DEAPVHDAEEPRRIMRRLLDDRREAEQPCPMLLEEHRERMLNERKPRRRLEVAPALLRGGMRGVVRGDDVDPILGERPDERVPIPRGLDGRVALDPCAEPRVVALLEPKVMDAHLRRDALAFDRPRLEELELALRAEMQDVESRAVPPRELHRPGRRRVAGLGGPDLEMSRDRHVVAVALPDAALG